MFKHLKKGFANIVADYRYINNVKRERTSESIKESLETNRTMLQGFIWATVFLAVEGIRLDSWTGGGLSFAATLYAIFLVGLFLWIKRLEIMKERLEADKHLDIEVK